MSKDESKNPETEDETPTEDAAAPEAGDDAGEDADEDAAAAFVRYEREILPDPDWAETYARMQPFFEKLYHHSQALYDDLDRL